MIGIIGLLFIFKADILMRDHYYILSVLAISAFPVLVYHIQRIGRPMPLHIPASEFYHSTGNLSAGVAHEIKVTDLFNHARRLYQTQSPPSITPHILEEIQKRETLRAYAEYILSQTLASSADTNFHIVIDARAEDSYGLHISLPKEQANFLAGKFYRDFAYPSLEKRLIKSKLHDNRTKYDIYSIAFEGRDDSVTFLNGLRIGRLYGDMTSRGHLSILNCWITEVRITGTSSDNRLNVYISSSVIHKFFFDSNCSGIITISDSYIKNLDYHASSDDSLLVGYFDADRNVEICPHAHSLDLPNVQSYSNLRKAFLRQGSRRMAMKLRVIELRAERQYDNFIVRIVSALFDFVSEYGTQPERSHAFCAIIMLYNGVLIGGSGRWTTSLDCAADGRLGGLANYAERDSYPPLLQSFFLHSNLSSIL